MYDLNLPDDPVEDLEATLARGGDRTHQLQERIENSTGVLSVEAGVGLGQVFPLGHEKALVGRSPECEVHIPDRDVSRYHLRIERDDLGNYLVHDLDSTNGTRVGGEPVHAYSLRDGDRIQVGRCSVLEFRCVESEADREALVRYHTALRDGETGAFSRAHFQWRLREEYGNARRNHELLSVVMLAPDHLADMKAVHGGGVEHAVLRRLAEVISRLLRDNDLLARFDHDTFAVLLRGQNEQRAFYAAERVRQIIRSTAFTYGEKPVNVTASCGFTTYRMQNFDEPRQLTVEAAENLNDARQQGGDTCVGLVTGERLVS